MSNVQSILPPDIRGVGHISGYRGLGKTTLCIQADAPPNIAFFDFEQKGESFHNQLNFGYYLSVVTEAAKRKRANGMLAVYEVFKEAIDALPTEQFTVAILDNVSPLETALNAAVKADANKFAAEYGGNIKNIIRGTMGGAKAVVNELVASWICPTLYAKGIQFIAMTSHVKPRWSPAGPLPNKYYIKGADRWEDLSVLTLALIPGDFPPVPSAIVMKEQLGVMQWDQERMDYVIKRRLPKRLPRATFAEIRRYLENPADLQNPGPGEEPTYAEFDPFDDKLSKEQINFIKVGAAAYAEEESEEIVGSGSDPSKMIAGPSKEEQAKQLKADNPEMSVGEIAEKVGAAVVLVSRWLK